MLYYTILYNTMIYYTDLHLRHLHDPLLARDRAVRLRGRLARSNTSLSLSYLYVYIYIYIYVIYIYIYIYTYMCVYLSLSLYIYIYMIIMITINTICCNELPPHRPGSFHSVGASRGPHDVLPSHELSPSPVRVRRLFVHLSLQTYHTCT